MATYYQYDDSEKEFFSTIQLILTLTCFTFNTTLFTNKHTGSLLFPIIVDSHAGIQSTTQFENRFAFLCYVDEFALVANKKYPRKFQ